MSFFSVSGALFGLVEHFPGCGGGSVSGFWCVAVYDAGGAWSAFCPWPRWSRVWAFCLGDFQWPCVGHGGLR